MTITGDHEFVPPDLQRRITQLETDLAKLRNSVGKLGLSRHGAGGLLVPGGITIGSGLGGGGVAAAGSGTSISATIPGPVPFVNVSTGADSQQVWIDFQLTYPTNAGQAQLQYFELWYRRTGDAAWSSKHVNALAFRVSPVQPNTQYDFQVRYVTNLGQVGPWNGGQITTGAGPWLGDIVIGADVDDGAWTQFQPDFDLFDQSDATLGTGSIDKWMVYRVHDRVCTGHFYMRFGASPDPGTSGVEDFNSRYTLQAPVQAYHSGFDLSFIGGVSWVQPNGGRPTMGQLLYSEFSHLALQFSFSHVFDASYPGTETYFGPATALGGFGAWFGIFMYQTSNAEGAWF